MKSLAQTGDPLMKPPVVSAEMLLQVQRDRQAIAAELPVLALQDARLVAAAAEDTLTGHLRRAIHASHRSLQIIATEAGIQPAALCHFLEGEQALQSNELDRLAAAAGVTVSLALQRP